MIGLHGWMGYGLTLVLVEAMPSHARVDGAASKPHGPVAIEEASAGAPAAPGRLVHRSLAKDPEHDYYVYVPKRIAAGAPMFVTVHGISRNVEEHATLFVPYAEQYGVVLVAPLFTRDRSAGYQWLSPDRSGQRADQTLDAILAEVAASTAARPSPFYLFGFSGGAQFAHRYAFAHPERVAAAALGAPGWYTFPDARRFFPYGLQSGAAAHGLTFDARRLLRVPFTVIVGASDTTDYHLRRNAGLDRQQGATRLDRARRWVDAMRAAARAQGIEPRVEFEQVPGIEHNFRQFMERGELGNRVFEALFPSRRAATSAR